MSQPARKVKKKSAISASRIRYILFFILSLAGIFLNRCTPTDGNDSEETRNISVTYEPQRWIVERIAGDDFNVNVLLPPGSDPESYSPTVRQLRELNSGKIWLHLNTIGFEQSLMKSLPSRNLKFVDLSEGIEMLGHTHGEGGDGKGHHHHHDHTEYDDGLCHDHDEGSFDPHLWSSVRNTEIIAANTLHELERINPTDSARYRKNFRQLVSELRELDIEIAEALKKGGAKSFMVRHPSLGYFARDYGLRQIATEAEGKEPSPLQLASLFKEAVNSGARVMVTEPGMAGGQAAELARNAGLRPLSVNLNSSNWLQEIKKLKDL